MAWSVLRALAWILVVGSVWAPVSRGSVAPFGRYGTAAGEFIEPNGIAIDNTDSDVYVLDSNNERVEKFTRNGVFLFAWGWGVADGRTHALQKCTKAGGCFAGFYGSGAGEFGFAEGLALDNDPRSPSFRDVYAVDISNHRVEKFSPSGRFLAMIGGGVNESARARGDVSREDICSAVAGDRCVAGRSGSAANEFEFRVEGNYIAVGADGTLYVGDHDRVQEFGPDGRYRRQISLTPKAQGTDREVGSVTALAVAEGGSLYVVRNGIRGVFRYTASGEHEQTLNEEGEIESGEGPTPIVALDPSGHVFLDYHVGEQHWLTEYDSKGSELVSFDQGQQDALHGMAYNASTGALYLVNANNNVRPLLAQVRPVIPPVAVDPIFTSFKTKIACLKTICL